VVSTWSKDKALAQQFIEFINQPQYVKALCGNRRDPGAESDD
jgi:maltose-binding protein MalE